MEITQVRNATIIVNYNNIKFLVDPWLMPKDYMEGFEAGINPHIRQPRVELPFAISDIVNVDAVIVTHVHPDHWDNFAKEALDKDIKMFVQNETDKIFMLNEGFNNVEILDENGTKFKDITLYKTGTQHGKREIIEPLCRSVNMPYDAMGVIFKSKEEKTLYLAGDTIWCEEVNTAIDKFKPEIIVVNACAATVFNGEHIIMGIEDIKEVLKKDCIETLIASHMDTVSHLSVTREDLRKFKKDNNVAKLLIPDDGGKLTL